MNDAAIAEYILKCAYVGYKPLENEELDAMRRHPMYKLLDNYVIDFDLRNYKVKTYQTSSEQAKALLLKGILDYLGEV